MSYFSFQPVLHNWCNIGRGKCYPVCVMVHIRGPLLLIGSIAHVSAAGFLSRYLSGPLQCVTINMCVVNTIFPSFLRHLGQNKGFKGRAPYPPPPPSPLTYATELYHIAFAHGAVGRRIDPSWGGPIELFLVPASAPRLV